ncbi:MAG: glycosyltransferase family 4 protein [Saprospiraceae bacterium]
MARRSFVNKDLAILMSHYDVTTYCFKTDSKILTPVSFLLQALYLLVCGWKFDYYISFFAGYHSLLPAIFSKWTGKKCFIFLGGTECFNYPTFKYGNFTKKWYGKSTCASVRRATLLIPVSENLIRSQSEYYEGDSKTQGIYHWCAFLNVPYRVISLEFDPNKFYRQDIYRVENSFITVAFGIEGPAYIRKGIDKVILIAMHLPEYSFTIIGCHKDDFPVPIPANVTLIPPVPYEDLPFHYSRHQFYLQLSIAEGFPSAICEAMLCECIPVGSGVAALPVIISTHGFIIGKRDDELILKTIRTALHYPEKKKLGQMAREHIISAFGPASREKEILKIFSEF